MNRITIILLFVSTVVYGEIIPTNRLATWSGNAGIPGGIPNRNTIFTNLGLWSGIDITGGTDMSAKINAMTLACTIGQVVQLPAGILKIGSPISIQRGITLRGTIIDGTNATTLRGSFVNSGFSSGLIYVGTLNANGKATNTITAGTSKGSTNITISAVDTDIHIGDIVFIDQVDDGTFIDGVGSAGARGDNGDRGSSASGGLNHHSSQQVEIQKVYGNGTSFDFWPPLAWSFNNTPTLFYRTVSITQSSAPIPYTRNAGVEDLTILNTDASNPGVGKGNNIAFYKAANCWAKNVTSRDASITHFLLFYCYRTEIRGCTFSNSIYLASSGGYGVALETVHSGLIEDNIFVRTRDFIRFDAGSSGNVGAYNYHTNALPATGSTSPQNTGIAHNSHPMMNLLEGNITYTPRADFTFGSSSHFTLLRNWLRGPNMDWAVGNGFAIELRHKASTNNLVGNVLGTPLTTSQWATRKSIHVHTNSTPSYSGYATFLIGGVDVGGGADISGEGASGQWYQWTNTIAAGNYDFIAGQTNWYSGGVTGAPSETIPDTYYYTAKPAYFGNLTWPPFAPDPLTYGETNNPAGWRYRFGTNVNYGELAVSATSLDFGVLYANDGIVERYLFLTNIGSATLTVNWTNPALIVYAPATGARFRTYLAALDAVQTVTLAPGETSLPILFTYTATQNLNPTNGYIDRSVFTLTGGGADKTVNCLAVHLYDFDTVNSPATNVAKANDFAVVGGSLVAGYDKMALYPGENGEAYFDFTLTNDSFVTLTAQVNATNAADNSFYVEVDGQPQHPYGIWDITPTGSGYESRTVGLRGFGKANRPDYPDKKWYLTAGNHYVKVVGRKANVRLKSFAVAAAPVIGKVKTKGATDAGFGVAFQK